MHLYKDGIETISIINTITPYCPLFCRILMLHSVASELGAYGPTITVL